VVPGRGPFCAGRGHQFIIVGMFTLFCIIKGRKISEKAATLVYAAQNSECSSSSVCESESRVVSLSVIAGLGPKPDTVVLSKQIAVTIVRCVVNLHPGSCCHRTVLVLRRNGS
jgi:hypothetical protein